MFIVVILLALLAFWIWSLWKMPSKRARDIFEAHGPAPDAVSDRDRAFVLDLHNRFGTDDFTHKAIAGRPLDSGLAERFGTGAASLDDLDELGVRLPRLNLLVSFEPGRYRLTDNAARLADRLAGATDKLETTHHG